MKYIIFTRNVKNSIMQLNFIIIIRGIELGVKESYLDIIDVLRRLLELSPAFSSPDYEDVVIVKVLQSTLNFYLGEGLD